MNELLTRWKKVKRIEVSHCLPLVHFHSTGVFFCFVFEGGIISVVGKVHHVYNPDIATVPQNLNPEAGRGANAGIDYIYIPRSVLSSAVQASAVDLSETNQAQS